MIKKLFLTNNVISYFKKYKLIYFGLILCNVFAYNFHKIFLDFSKFNILSNILILFFFFLSFALPLIFGIVFCCKSFVAKDRKEAISNIVHSYIATIMIFGATYYQCCVLGDYNDAINKKENYRMQKSMKQQSYKNASFIKVNDQRAFKGIRSRLWSGLDEPNKSLLTNYRLKNNFDIIINYSTEKYEDLSIEQIERITNSIDENRDDYIEYLKKNQLEVYGDCLYYSVICIATVGFGDISPCLWYTKLFTVLEIIAGITIFVFSIGFLFSQWTIAKK